MPSSLEPLLVKPCILLAGRREALPARLTSYLAKRAMQVAHAPDQAALFAALSDRPSLILMNSESLGGDVMDILRRLRARYGGGLILVSDRHRQLTDCVLALEMGADDYLVGPLDLRELTARIRNILRRRGLAQCGQEQQTAADLRFGVWELDGATQLLKRQGRSPVRLTRTEFTLLGAFLQSPQQVLTRQDLLRATRGHPDLFDRTVDSQVRRLRLKLQGGRHGRDVIATVRGVGYVFNAQIAPS